MKRVAKGDEPLTLTTYRDAVPHGIWEEMKDDPHYCGRQAYTECRSQSIADQQGLCAYCEISIRDNNPLKCRVEHFHPKSDTSTPHNWALDWQNMLGVCNGGDNPHLNADGFHLHPTSANLSCDAYKNRMVLQHKLPTQCEGEILNPLQLAAFPCVFRLDKGNGYLYPDAILCAAAPPWPNNRHSSVEELIRHTIDMLNLNCDRLAQERLQLIRDIERNKKKQRQAGYGPQQGLRNLAQHYFRTTWPSFFTTIRFCLGQAAETYLNDIAYQG